MPENNEHIDIYELIAKKLDGSLTQSEEVLLEQLLTDPESRKAYEEASAVWSAAGQAVQQFDTEAALLNVTARIEAAEKPVRKLFPAPAKWAIAVAASVALLISVYIFRPNDTADTDYIAVETSVTDYKAQLLDGTDIVVKEGATLSYAQDFETANKREVKLDGEAFFEVKRDVDRPFIIHTKYIDVQVLGTSFFVKAYGNDSVATVSVVSGKVAVISRNDTAQRQILTPGEATEYSAKENQLSLKEAPADLGFWKGRLLKFKRERLGKAVKIINRHYSPKLAVPGYLEDCRITASFEDKNIDQVVATLAGTLELTYEQINDTIYFDGPACD